VIELLEGFSDVVEAVVHAQTVCLDHRAIVVNVDDQSGKVVAFTMHQAKCGCWGVNAKTQVDSEIEAVLKFVFPEFYGGFDGLKSNHSDGDAAVSHLSGAQQFVSAIEDLDPIAHIGIVEFLDRTREHPRMFSE